MPTTNMNSPKPKVLRLRIVQRQPDGPVFPWSEALALRADMRGGYKEIGKDGKARLVMDRAKAAAVGGGIPQAEYDRVVAENRILLAKIEGVDEADLIQLPAEEDDPTIPELPPPPLEELTVIGADDGPMVKNLSRGVLDRMNKCDLLEHHAALGGGDLDPSEMTNSHIADRIEMLQADN